MAETAAAALIAPAATALIGSIRQQSDDAACLEDRYRELMLEASLLGARKKRLDSQAARDRVRGRTEEFEAWTRNVGDILGEVDKLKEEYNAGKWRRLIRKLLFSSYKADLSRRIATKCQMLKGLWAKTGKDIEVMDGKLPRHVIKLREETPKIREGSSLHKAIEEARRHLRDRNVKKIGVWGHPGIDKTTILEILNEKEETDKMFEMAIFVTANKDDTVRNLQKDIAKRLILDLGESDEAEVALLISQELQSRRYLLLLDGVTRRPIDLSAVGIRDIKTGSKVVLASTSEMACRGMDVDEYVCVKPLSDGDALKMFWEKVGRTSNTEMTYLDEIARDVVKRCSNLPIVIDRVAMCFKMKNKEISLWKAGRDMLKIWPVAGIEGMEELFDFLRFCYDDLGDEAKKKCFLFAALYPEDYDIFIGYLLECWKARGFSDGDNLTEARNRGDSILTDLLDVALLERSSKMKHVRLDKVMRNVALKISSEADDSRVLVKARKDMKEAPSGNEWKGMCGISLMDNKLSRLPTTVACPELRTLLLQKNRQLSLIEESFFDNTMPLLQVLDLHGCGITSLPRSVSSLENLTALYLNSCKYLTELPANIKLLEKLEVLDIRGSGINNLPDPIRDMPQLRCLRISLSNSRFTSLSLGQSSFTFRQWLNKLVEAIVKGLRYLKFFRSSSNFGSITDGQSRFALISKDVISSLSSLEELAIDVDPHSQTWWDGVVVAVIHEVALLNTLTSLSFCFPSVASLKIFLQQNSSFLEGPDLSFQFSVGYHEETSYPISDHFGYDVCRYLKYAKGENVDDGICKVLALAHVFELICHKGISSISAFGTENIKRVQGCLIEGCTSIQSILEFNVDDTTPASFESLEKMVIVNAPILTSIIAGTIRQGSLAKLTILRIYTCPGLLKIFLCKEIRQLSKLQQLQVEDCSEIEEIIREVQSSVSEPRCISRLETLILINLPKLVRIWDNASLQLPSLKDITVRECPSLTTLPFSESNASELRYITGETWWEGLEWAEADTKTRLECRCIFKQ